MIDHQPVFIVGTGRCGSTLMSNLVRMHPDILSLSEVFVSFATEGFVHRRMDGERFWRLISDAAPVLRKAINPERSPIEFTYEFSEDSSWTMETLPPCLYMTLPHLSGAPDVLYREMEPVLKARGMAPMAEQYKFWFDWMAERHGKSLWIERSGNSITMVEALHRLFPNAKFVHIHRDGRETAMSIQNFMPLRIFFHTWVRLRRIGIDLLKTPFRYSDSRLINFFAPFITRLMPMDRFLDTEPDIVDVGAFWSAMIMQGLKDLSKVPAENVHTMTYADLVQKPHQTLEGFADFVAPGLDHSKWLDAASKLPKASEPKWKSLSQDKITGLEKACAPAMDALGYKY